MTHFLFLVNLIPNRVPTLKMTRIEDQNCENNIYIKLKLTLNNNNNKMMIIG